MDDAESQNPLPAAPVEVAPAAAPNTPRSALALLLQLWSLRALPPAAGPSTALLICVALFSLLLWLTIDWLAALPDPQFLAAGAPLLAWYALAILVMAALLRWQSRPRPAFEAALLLSSGLVPVPLLLAAVVAPYLNPFWLIVATIAVLVYCYSYLARGLHAFTGRRQRIAGFAGLAFLIGFVWVTDALEVIPDVWAAPEAEEAVVGNDAHADAETLLFEQSARIDQALAAVHADASSAPKGFFLGFAGVGDQKVFAQEIGLASRVLSERYGMDGRSLSLINDERDLERSPLASVSGLKYALRGLAGRMNLDRDVLFLAISSHGARDPAIAVANSDLPLDDLTDEDLAAALRDSGIRWRVIIISACYAGGFIDALKDPRTILIAAAAADRTSFGCSNDSDLTYFGEAFYRDALPEARTLRDAFEKARAAIAMRERRERVDASRPQAYFGSELEAKLAAMKDHPP
ncbi:MAG TPA: C13 family peptidase [Steroidobacteraceae bacterium]|nr:C13 family peptidase [Steroidobacteraceae bacterium]